MCHLLLCIQRMCNTNHLLLSISVSFLVRFFFFYLEHIVIWIFSPSADCSKTFRVSLGSDQPPQKARQLHPLFIPIGHCTHRHVMQSYTHIRILINSVCEKAHMQLLLVHSKHRHTNTNEKSVSSCRVLHSWPVYSMLTYTLTVMLCYFCM